MVERGRTRRWVGRGRWALASAAGCALACSGCGSSGGSSPSQEPRSAAGVRATLASFDRAFKANEASDICRRYFTAKAITTIETVGGSKCATAVALLRRTGSGFDFTHVRSVNVSGDQATVVAGGVTGPAKLIYVGGRWRFEARSPRFEGGASE
jgi:hypothetical protein